MCCTPMNKVLIFSPCAASSSTLLLLGTALFLLLCVIFLLLWKGAHPGQAAKPLMGEAPPCPARPSSAAPEPAAGSGEGNSSCCPGSSPLRMGPSLCSTTTNGRGVSAANLVACTAQQHILCYLQSLLGTALCVDKWLGTQQAAPGISCATSTVSGWHC